MSSAVVEAGCVLLGQSGNGLSLRLYVSRDIKELNKRGWWIRHWGREFQVVGRASVKTDQGIRVLVQPEKNS